MPFPTVQNYLKVLKEAQLPLLFTGYAEFACILCGARVSRIRKTTPCLTYAIEAETNR